MCWRFVSKKLGIFPYHKNFFHKFCVLYQLGRSCNPQIYLQCIVSDNYNTFKLDKSLTKKIVFL